ncbi:IclR family transcriptional regulator C-terminal domain-containing protein [Nocardia sp. NPDC049220]|uniref:IclR family transcriptional regulator domain-containing protein n=1 Tax=Nocardia sp. NPDC049220 TaxID=3155273 RepID=UPI0033C6AB13
MDVDDNELGIHCVAAPVRDAARAIVGAISVSATTPYMPPECMRGLIPVVRRTPRAFRPLSATARPEAAGPAWRR